MVGCVDTGDWTCLLKEEQTDPKLRDQAAQSLEHLCLLSFYLRWSLPGLSLAPLPVDGPEQGILRDLVGRILSEVRDAARVQWVLHSSDGLSSRTFILSKKIGVDVWNGDGRTENYFATERKWANGNLNFD